MWSRVIKPGAEPVSRRGLWSNAAARAFALFFGGFTLLNLAGNLVRANFDSNLWWIDLRILPPFLALGLLLATSLGLVGFAFRPPRSQWGQALTVGGVALLTMAALWNTIEFYILCARGELRPFMPLPISLLVGAALTLILFKAAQPPRKVAFASVRRGMFVMFGVCLIAFPLAQMICFGKTDYRRPADVAVVFGARAYADGRPSDALADRVRTACQLYQDGTVGKLIFSGGPGDGAVDEPEAMRRMAIRLGVKPADILMDPEGLNTQATVKNTEALFAQLHARRVLVVSHFYHLPRIKLAYQREGWDVYTVPARESYLLRQLPWSMAREVPAMWVYYLRPLLS